MPRKYVDERGAVQNLVVRGADATHLQIADRFRSGSLSFSTTAITSASLTFAERGDFSILGSGIFRPASGNAPNEGQCDLDGLRLQLASVGTQGRGRETDLSVTARSMGGARMAANTDPSTLSKIDPAEWVRRKAESLGMRTVVKASGQVWAQVGNESGKDSWTTATGLAKDLGYWCFEAAGVLYFGPPTWLIAQTTRRRYGWRGADPEFWKDPTNELLSAPAFREISDADPGMASVSVALKLRDTENDLVPGMGLELDVPGMGTYGGAFIITAVTVPLGPGAAIEVTAETPTDPLPGDNTSKYVRSEALENASQAVATGTSTRTPPAGRYGGTSFTAEQIGHAVTITLVARERRLTMPKAAVLAVMCALQESTLRNLNGGDRDSVGLFQQRPSQGWGTAAQCRMPSYAAGKFYDELVRRAPAYASTATTTAMGDAIQRVQRSGFPRAYDKWRDEAEALVAAIIVTGTTTSSAAAASTPASAGGQVEAFVQKCLAQAGDRYVFGAETRLADPDPNTFDCSELVEWACYQVGVKIPDGSQNQRRVCKAFRQLSIAQAMATRGALVFTSGHVAVSLGDGRTIEAKGRKYGVVVDVVGKRFTDAGLIPGMAGYQVRG